MIVKVLGIMIKLIISKLKKMKKKKMLELYVQLVIKIKLFAFVRNVINYFVKDVTK